MKSIGLSAVLAFAVSGALPAAAQDAQAMQRMMPPAETAGEIEADGTVVVAPFRLPPSVYLSEEAAAALPREAVDQMAQLEMLLKAPNPAAIRPMAAQFMKPLHDRSKAEYGVSTQAGVIAGVPVMIAQPAGGVPDGNRDKVLINFPGGGFVAGTADGTGMTESIPLAGLAGVKIVSISYRQAPEHRFPAASEDSATVYRELLKTYKPENIGIFGCSAGGALAAQSIAWYEKEGLPLPGAAGIFCASADRFRGGDSSHYARPFAGLAPQKERSISYFDGSEMDDPLVSPAMHPELMAKFPPTLVISATRAFEMSSAIATHRALVNAGVEADLHLWDGLGHAFFYDHSLPESREAFAVMDAFFTRHLDLAE